MKFQIPQTVQIFDDSSAKDQSKARIFVYDTNKIARAQQKGCGIFFPINPQDPPTQRNIEHTSHFAGVGLDLDITKEKVGIDESIRTQRKAELEARLYEFGIDKKLIPTFIIETKNGLQPLWLFAEPFPLVPSNRRLANEIYKSVCVNLSQAINFEIDGRIVVSEGDNISRVFRLPGSLHLKNPQDPFEIKLIFSEGKVHDAKIFIERFNTYQKDNTSQRKSSSEFGDIDWKEIVSGFGWLEVVEGMEESETRTFKGKIYTGRNDLMKSVADSVFSVFELKDIPFDPAECVRWLNSMMAEPLMEIEIIIKQADRFTSSHPPKGNNRNNYQRTNQTKQSADLPPLKFYSQQVDLTAFEKIPRQPLGFSVLDEKFDFPAGFYLFVAPPGGCKSWLSLYLARRWWEEYKNKTVLFSLEMSESLVRGRLLQAWSDLTEEEYLSGTNTDKAQRLLKQDAIVVDEFGQQDAAKMVTPENYERRINELYALGYRNFIFDHIHEIPGSIANETNAQILEPWSLTFQKISKKYTDVWQIVFAQPNAASAAKRVLRRIDMMGSKGPSYKADVFISLNRNVKTKEKDLSDSTDPEENRDIFFWVDKNRKGTNQLFGWHMIFLPTGNFEMVVSPSINTDGLRQDIGPGEISGTKVYEGDF